MPFTRLSTVPRRLRLARPEAILLPRLLDAARKRYFARAANGVPLAALGTAAWKSAPRDRLAGWAPETRCSNLPFVVNNARFLMLPWVHKPRILALVQRRLPDDREDRHALCTVPLEIFCESPRFDGTCCRTANWAKVGRAQGRDKLDVRNERSVPVKDAEAPAWKRILNK